MTTQDAIRRFKVTRIQEEDNYWQVKEEEEEEEQSRHPDTCYARRNYLKGRTYELVFLAVHSQTHTWSRAVISLAGEKFTGWKWYPKRENDPLYLRKLQHVSLPQVNEL